MTQTSIFGIYLQMDRNRDLVRRFEEQTGTIKEMNRELVDLRSQLTVTHQGKHRNIHFLT